MAAPEPENLRFQAANADFSETGSDVKPNKFGEKQLINDARENFIFLTRSMGSRGTYFYGSGVVVEGEEDVYLATAAHKYKYCFSRQSILKVLVSQYSGVRISSRIVT